jgi:hypothetical protein
VFTKVETVTPVEALKILQSTEKKGARNRALSTYRVTLFANQMKRGLWRLTHQGIALDKSGCIVDGQHRLSAIVEAGVPVKMPVTRGLDNGSIEVIDRGRTRTLGDVIHIKGQENGTRRAAIIRAMISFVNDDGRDLAENQRVVDQDVLDTLDKFKSDLDWVLSMPSAARLGSAPVQAAMVIAHAVYPTEMDGIARKFFTGAAMDHGDPMLTLRNHLLKIGRSDMYLRRFLMKLKLMRIVFNALAHSIKGEKIVRCYDVIAGYQFFKDAAKK